MAMPSNNQSLSYIYLLSAGLCFRRIEFISIQSPMLFAIIFIRFQSNLLLYRKFLHITHNLRLHWKWKVKPICMANQMLPSKIHNNKNNLIPMCIRNANDEKNRVSCMSWRFLCVSVNGHKLLLRYINLTYSMNFLLGGVNIGGSLLLGP